MKQVTQVRTKKPWKLFLAATVLITSAYTTTASAWDFDKTRSRDIVDRAINDGDLTAQLLLAMALDDRIHTIFDDFDYRLPVKTDGSKINLSGLSADRLYQNLMIEGGSQGAKEAVMAYTLQGTYALEDEQYTRARNYYSMASQLGRELEREQGMNPDLTAMVQDAKAGWLAAKFCLGEPAGVSSTNELSKTLAGLRNSQIAEEYRRFIYVQHVGLVDMPGFKHPIKPHTPDTIGFDNAGCWDRPLESLSVILPTAPYNYEKNTLKSIGVLQ